MIYILDYEHLFQYQFEVLEGIQGNENMSVVTQYQLILTWYPDSTASGDSA